MDKGTFDAISLGEKKEENRKNYVETIRTLLEPNEGIFVITSCNFTKKELLTVFEKTFFKYLKQVRYPQIEFGGKTGSTVCTLAFKLTEEGRRK